jgi:hypothetical protein
MMPLEKTPSCISVFWQENTTDDSCFFSSKKDFLFHNSHSNKG